MRAMRHNIPVRDGSACGARRKSLGDRFPIDSAGQLCRKHVYTLNGRRFGEELTCLCHQSRRNLAGKMGLAACFIRKGVENPEGCWPKANAKPSGSGGLFHDEREATHEKIFDLLLLPGLRFQANE